MTEAGRYSVILESDVALCCGFELSCLELWDKCFMRQFMFMNNEGSAGASVSGQSFQGFQSDFRAFQALWRREMRLIWWGRRTIECFPYRSPSQPYSVARDLVNLSVVACLKSLAGPFLVPQG